MTITQGEIIDLLDKYIATYPREAGYLEPLRAVAERSSDFWSRSSFPLHVTCSAAVVNDDGRVLMIRHRALNKWLLPGGHLESSDGSLIGAALRELREETAIGKLPILSDEVPIDIDIHDIPASPSKGEPEHYHGDLRFLFRFAGGDLAIQEEEVTACVWRDLGELPTQRLAEKLSEIALKR